MDPVTLLGTAGAVANIIDLLGKTISTIHGLHQQWKAADFTLLNLVSQLTALKAALGKIEEYMDTVDDQHLQLVMDLDLITTCIEMLVRKIDDHILGARPESNEALTSKGKAKLILGSKETRELQSMIQNQTSALTLLLTACNCKTIAEQSTALEKKRTRKAILRVEKDTASLMEIRDDNSFTSRYTDALSKLSLVFTFDHVLFNTTVYNRITRNSIKAALRRHQDPVLSCETMADTAQHRMRPWGDLNLPQGQESDLVWPLGGDYQNFLLGLPNCSKDLLMEQLILRFDPRNSGLRSSDHSYTKEIQKRNRCIVYRHVVALAKDLVNFLIESDRWLEHADSHRCEMIATFFLDPHPYATLDQDFVNALNSIWKDPWTQLIMSELHECHQLRSAHFFLDSVERINGLGYIPTEEDIQRCAVGIENICDIRTYVSEALNGSPVATLSMKVVETTCYESKLPKSFHQFQTVSSIIYVVDLACYDQEYVGTDGEKANKMMQSIALYKSIITTQQFEETAMILILANTSIFNAKLAESPLQNYFPDFTDAQDADKAAEYILERFCQAKDQPSNFYSLKMNIAHGSDLERLWLMMYHTTTYFIWRGVNC